MSLRLVRNDEGAVGEDFDSPRLVEQLADRIAAEAVSSGQVNSVETGAFAHITVGDDEDLPVVDEVIDIIPQNVDPAPPMELDDEGLPILRDKIEIGSAATAEAFSVLPLDVSRALKVPSKEKIGQRAAAREARILAAQEHTNIEQSKVGMVVAADAVAVAEVVKPEETGIQSSNATGLVGRVLGVGRWLRREVPWIGLNVTAGVTAAFAAKAALTAAPLLVAAGVGIVASNIVTNTIRSAREAAKAEQEKQIQHGIGQTSFGKLFFKSIFSRKTYDRSFLKNTVSGVAFSAATFGIISNFSEIKEFVSGIFGGGHSSPISHAVAAGAAGTEAVTEAAQAVSDFDPIAQVEADIAAGDAGTAECRVVNQSWCDDPVAAMAQQKIEAGKLAQDFGRIADGANEAISLDPANASRNNEVYMKAIEGMQTANDLAGVTGVTEVAAAPLSAFDQAKELLGGNTLSAKSKALIEAMIAHPDNAQLAKDAAQSLVKGHEELAKQLYQKAIDTALEPGQKTAWAQASIDLAYLNHETAPAEAMAQMQTVAEKTKGALHRIAQEFVDQWKGVHSTNVAPVDVVQNQMAEEAARKAAEAAAAPLDVVELPAGADGRIHFEIPASEGTDIPFADPLTPKADELARVQEALNADYARKEMVDYLTATGQTPAEELSNLELAQLIEPENAQGVLAGLEATAPKLDSSQFAFACASDIPAEVPVAGGEVNIHTDCNAYKSTVSDGDFGTVRDLNRPNSLQYFFIKASGFCSAVADCVDKIVTREIVPSMHHSLR